MTAESITDVPMTVMFILASTRILDRRRSQTAAVRVAPVTARQAPAHWPARSVE